LLTQLGGLLVPRRLFAGALLCGLAFPFGLQQLLFQGRLARLLGLLLLGAQFFYVSAVRLALDRPRRFLRAPKISGRALHLRPQRRQLKKDCGRDG